MVTDEKAAELFNAHRDVIYRFLWRFTRSADVAEDLTQETFLQFLAAKGTSVPQQQRSFLIGIARKLALKHWRTERRWKELEESADLSHTVDWQRIDVGCLVEAAINSLPPLQRETLILATYEGFRLEEISAAIGVDVGVVKSRLHRARSTLKLLLAPLKASIHELR